MTERTIEQQLADSDRMLGDALRRLSYLQDTEEKRRSWLHEAKRAEGYTDATSFDDVWANVRAERDRLRVALAADPVRVDTERLDWLDWVNVKTNERQGSKYGWRFDINENRAALTDHNIPARSIREAIDAARCKHEQ